ncbi:MAG: hypothetical protein K6E10_12570 [Eubacterium sp.]|nr:hypothetical protein [Eubacterium sp.]
MSKQDRRKDNIHNRSQNRRQDRNRNQRSSQEYEQDYYQDYYQSENINYSSNNRINRNNNKNSKNNRNNSQKNRNRRSTDPNIIRLSRAARLNSAIILFVLIFIYVIACVIKSISKEPITTYKVGSSNINNNINCVGIALRNEVEITSSKSGYLIYFVRDGDKIKKNSPVCTVDETGNVIAAIKATGESDEGNKLFTSSDYAHIRTTIDTYKSSYSDIQFNNLYNFKSDIESKVMELSSEVMMDQINSGGAAVSSTLQTIKAPDSGVITYYTDGYEKKTPETLSDEDFNQNNYKKNSLKSGEIQSSGSTVFKIVADEDWHVVCKISNDQYKAIAEESKLRFTLNGSAIDMSANFSTTPKDDGYLLTLDLNKYMVDYIDERFLNVEIILNKFEGLKVPNSALIDKEVYKIPKSYVLNAEGHSNVKEVNVLRFDEKASSGEPSEKKVDLIVYKTDDDYFYVDKDAFLDTDQVYQGKTSELTPVLSLERAQLTGVYLANMGIADFIEVVIVKSQDEFTILQTDGNLKEFDNIVLDAEEVKDGQTLY